METKTKTNPLQNQLFYINSGSSAAGGGKVVAETSCKTIFQVDRLLGHSLWLTQCCLIKLSSFSSSIRTSQQNRTIGLVHHKRVSEWVCVSVLLAQFFYNCSSCILSSQLAEVWWWWWWNMCYCSQQLSSYIKIVIIRTLELPIFLSRYRK